MYYPIRPSRPFWSITFSKPHVCDVLCNAQYELTSGSIRLTYTTGCLFPEKIEQVNIHISEHKNNNNYINYEIFNIPKTVNILIDYPMKNSYTKTITFDTDKLFISDILREFDCAYKEIYEDEEKTTTQKQYRIKTKCMECDDSFYHTDNLGQHMTSIENNLCNICFDESGNFCKLACEHIFHKECIYKWYNTKKEDIDKNTVNYSNSCPNCRSPIIRCIKCKGYKYTEEIFTGTVPPWTGEFLLNRWLTDGKYQIFGHYYEELYFKGFVYNNINNTLSLIPKNYIEYTNPIDETLPI